MLSHLSIANIPGNRFPPLVQSLPHHPLALPQHLDLHLRAPRIERHALRAICEWR